MRPRLRWLPGGDGGRPPSTVRGAAELHCPAACGSRALTRPCSVPLQLPQPGATWDTGLPPNPDQLSRGRGPSGRGCPWTYSPTPAREAKVLLGLGGGMAAEPGQQEEGRWEREGAILAVELVLVGDDLMLVWQLVVVGVAEDPGETEEEEDDDDEAREVESEAEEDGEAEEGEETEEEDDELEESEESEEEAEENRQEDGEEEEAEETGAWEEAEEEGELGTEEGAPEEETEDVKPTEEAAEEKGTEEGEEPEKEEEEAEEKAREAEEVTEEEEELGMEKDVAEEQEWQEAEEEAEEAEQAEGGRDKEREVEDVEEEEVVEKKEMEPEGEEKTEEEEQVEEVEEPEKAEEEEGQEEDEEAVEDEVAEVPVQEEEKEDRREEAWEGSQKEGDAQELQEKREGEEQPEARPGPPPSPLQALAALQSELEPLHKDASGACSGLKLRLWQRRRRHLEHRSALIRGIPGFWAKAFGNHPQLSAMLSEQDEGILGSMTDLQVEELGSPRDRRRVLLFFRKNSYFRNEVVEKEYVLRAAGYEPSHSTPIQWHPCYEREARSRRHHNSSLNFFNWLSDHSFAGSSRIAEIVMDDLWPNPLQYYMRKKAPAEELRGVQELQHVEVNTQEPCA
ncbi:testis-specific Y-encoded-like protein 4 [Mustela lutreola]|uniref:testis-specific Y-encoded-like protein 4 n=1 Tax=Mustela lutreola TaxID=9666 RepID=UPI002797A70E|nr:testis-specific Y-encoded-like protein 4 [Mustela lutreola]